MGILIQPLFKEVPKSSLANVQENIDLWISKGDFKSLKELCVCEGNGKYRFICAEDLTESILQKKQFVSYSSSNKRGIYVNVLWERGYKFYDSFSPLYFKESYTTIYILYYNHCFVYKSDAQLRRFCKAICDNIVPDYN